MRHLILPAALAGGLSMVASAVQAEVGDKIAKAVSDSKVNMSLRYRFEGVSDDAFDEDAEANTVLGRLTAKTGQVDNFHAVVEFDYVGELFDESYNDTVNGNTQFPVVADPSGADFNQVYFQYSASKNTNIRFGRQRINHNDQRFVGGVAWRQNEQTFDGVRIQSQVNDKFHVDYSYAYNVNRIFGSDSPRGDLDSNLHMLNAKYKPTKNQALAFFAYSMDFNDAAALSNRTFGVDYRIKGKTDAVKYGLHASIAHQQDNGDSPFEYSAQFFALDANVSYSGVTFGAGFESLGADNGRGFIMPLATLHKFQGWADKFLATPGVGVEDTWFKVATKVGGVKLSAIYHQFEAEEGDIDFGDELNLLATYKFNSHYSVLVKYAKYDADEFSTDSNRYWLQLLAKY